MTTNPDGFLRHFHVICSYGLTPYRKSALLLGEGTSAKPVGSYFEAELVVFKPFFNYHLAADPMSTCVALFAEGFGDDYV